MSQSNRTKATRVGTVSGLVTLNVNDVVLVQLNDRGRGIISEQVARGLEHTVREDGEGWSSWQLWHLMEVFGHHLHLGAQMPFDSQIRIRSNDLGEVAP